MNKNFRVGDGTRGRNHTHYTRRDMEHFEKIMDFADVGAEVVGHDEPPQLAPISNYTDGDTHQFEKLMTFREGSRRSRSKRPGEPAGSYTDSDIRLFDELMSFDQRAAVTAYTDTLQTQESVPTAFGYTPQDLQTFRTLMPDDRRGNNAQPDDPLPGRSGADADVGHIRIVDFDEENSRRTGTRERGNRGMKIRFFD